MVGSLGANAAASIGLVSTTTWLFWGVCAAAATGFSVQVAHRIGAGDFVEAKKILRQAVTATLVFSSLLAVGGICISGMLPLWLGGDEAIWNDSSLYFRIFALFLPALQLNFLAGGMLRCSGNMRVPAMLNIMMCLLDVVFNFFLIFPTRHVEWFGVVFTAPGAGLGVKGAILGTVLAELVTAGGMMWYLCRRSPMLKFVGERGSFLPNGRHCVSLSVFRYRWDSNTWPFVERRSQRRWLSHRSASLPLLPTRSPLLPKAFAICRLRHLGGCHDVGRSEPWSEPYPVAPSFCQYYRLVGNADYGCYGSVDICGGSANHRSDDSRGGNPHVGNRDSADRSLCRADVCGIYRCLRCIRRCG